MGLHGVSWTPERTPLSDSNSLIWNLPVAVEPAVLAMPTHGKNHNVSLGFRSLLSHPLTPIVTPLPRALTHLSCLDC